MKRFRSLDVGALVLCRAFGLTEISQLFWYENRQILMNESATPTSVGDEFLQPLLFTSQSLHPRVVFLTFSEWVMAFLEHIFKKCALLI
jgi:hypothetical protein